MAKTYCGNETFEEVREGAKYYELVVVWNSGEKEIYSYNTEYLANKAKSNMEMAFGRQLWACVREKRG